MRRTTIWKLRSALLSATLASTLIACAAIAETLTPQQQFAYDIYKELVEINTVTATGDTAKAAEAMAARLRAAGFADGEVQVLQPAPRKGNLVVRLARYRRAQADPPACPYRRGACKPRGLVGRSVQADREGRLLLWTR
jgi:acetylornithine deacetylase/succinyl-diaminopimelate desuccinylase-like protein